MQTAPLTANQWGSCILIGIFALPWGVLVRLIPIDNTFGQIELDPTEFEVLPFPDDPIEQEVAQQQSKDEAGADEDGDKTPRGSKRRRSRSRPKAAMSESLLGLSRDRPLLWFCVRHYRPCFAIGCLHDQILCFLVLSVSAAVSHSIALILFSFPHFLVLSRIHHQNYI